MEQVLYSPHMYDDFFQASSYGPPHMQYGPPHM